MWNVSKEILAGISKELKGPKNMFKISSAAEEGPLEISCEIKGEESSNHNKLVQNNLKPPFEVMVKLFSSLCKLLQITSWADRFIKNC